MTQEEWLRNKLRSLKQNGIGAAETLAHRVDGICDTCLEACFTMYLITMYLIDDAIDKQPLPHDNCACTGDAAVDRDPSCDCTYLPAYADNVPS